MQMSLLAGMLVAAYALVIIGMTGGLLLAAVHLFVTLTIELVTMAIAAVMTVVSPFLDRDG